MSEANERVAGRAGEKIRSDELLARASRGKEINESQRKRDSDVGPPECRFDLITHECEFIAACAMVERCIAKAMREAIRERREERAERPADKPVEMRTE